MNRALSLLCLTVLLSSCAPAERQYCARIGTPMGHPEYNNCVNYFYRMSNWFARDREPCLAQAKETYPDYLYDRGQWGEIDYYGGNRGYGGIYGRSNTIRIPPDAWKNHQLDQLRLKLITPCMQARGWNSGESWELGRNKPPLKP